jgi:hypothetical protein
MEVGSPFGSKTRTHVLLALQLHGQSYPRELARLLASPLSVVQKALRSLEQDALITGRMLGRTRLFQLDPGYFALPQLQGFLARLLQTDDRLKARAASRRRRPRRTESASEGRRAAEARPARSRGDEPAAGGSRPGRPDQWRVW